MDRVEVERLIAARLEPLESRVRQLQGAPAFSAYLAVGINAHFANGAFTKAPIDTLEREVPAGIVRLATDDVLIPETGWWQISGGVFFNAAMPANTLTALACLIDVGLGAGPVERKRLRHEIQTFAGQQLLLGSTLVYVARGNVVSVWGFQNSGAAVRAESGLALAYFAGVRVGA